MTTAILLPVTRLGTMRFPLFSIIQIARRIALVWAIEVVALVALGRVLPGLTLGGWHSAVIAVAVIALLNALVRPVLLFLMMPVTLITFGFLTIALNAVILLLADRLVTGMNVSGIGTAVLTTLGLALINTVLARLLSIDDQDSFYRNVVRRLSRRGAPPAGTATTGLIFIEIDGLAKRYLEQAISRGYMPTLARWLSRGTHRIARWDCGVPSQTSSSQAGILHGNNFDIPAFRWYDKTLGRVIVSNHPGDAALIESRVSNGQGLLHNGGVSVCNMLSGDAETAVATASTFPGRGAQASGPGYFNYFINPYNFVRSVFLSLWEMVVELVQSTSDVLSNRQPRVSRGGWFPFLRAISTVVQRDISVHLMTAEMFSGVPAAYTTFVGYDVVAHHTGSARRTTMRVLRDIDQRIHYLHRAALDSPRPYRFVILSDHGHSPSVPFEQLYGQSLESLVDDLLGETERVFAAGTPPEGWGHLNTLLSDAIRYERFAGRAARRILRRRTRAGLVDLAPATAEAEPGDPNVVVCVSGNLGLVFFADLPGRVNFESVAARYPQLIEGLVAHNGIDWVLAHSAEYGALVMGKHGVNYLEENRLEGDDPLAHYGPGAADHLRRLDSFPHSGDLVLGGRFDVEAGHVVAFEEQVSSHGGLGGPQTEPFIMYPAMWALNDDEIKTAPELFEVLESWRSQG